MTTKTRFRPSANGLLHFGGAYVARQNWWFAKARGGKFVLIVDDVVPVFKSGRSDELAAKMREYGDAFRRDLDWLGWGPDECHYASEFAAAHSWAAAELDIPALAEYPRLQHLNRNVRDLSDVSVMSSYHPWLTAGRVSDDHELGVTEFVRGGDLVGEVQLYDHFARSLYGEGYRIWQEYTAIVVEPAGDVCSKTEGTAAIADYREAGVTPEQIQEALANCLTLPWSYGAAHLCYMQVDEQHLRVPSTRVQEPPSLIPEPFDIETERL